MVPARSHDDATPQQRRKELLLLQQALPPLLLLPLNELQHLLLEQLQCPLRVLLRWWWRRRRRRSIRHFDGNHWLCCQIPGGKSPQNKMST